jgi:nucleotide-binding universal stress UspA family protein
MQCLLALINGCETDAASLRAASALANSTGGNLTVALIRTAEALPIGTLDTVVMSNNSISAQEALTRGRAIYSDECGELSNCRLEEIDAAIPDTIERVSPYHDLIVVGRLSDREGPNALAFSAALWSGRCAVLVSPVSDNVQEPMQHVAVAWNGSAQAGRALRAALPFLRKATEVSVLQRQGSAEDIGLKRYLATHGIKQVQFRNYGEARLTGRGWGRALLSETDAIGADLLVMGAYGGWMGNLLGFGRATEKIVTSAKVPVLLSA